jgi:hypothetical protein
MTGDRRPLLQRATEYTEELIYAALLELLGKSPAAQMRLAEPEVARKALSTARSNAALWVYGDFGILVDVGSPWHTSKRVLIEEIIVRFRRDYGNKVEGAIAQLDVIAKAFGCVAVAAGDTQIGLMSPRYLAAGFQPLGTQFYKEIP